MIRARLSNGTFLFGVDAGNLERLKKGQPLAIDLFALGGRDKLVIIYGDSMADIERDLKKVFGRLPPAQPFTEGHS